VARRGSSRRSPAQSDIGTAVGGRLSVRAAAFTDGQLYALSSRIVGDGPALAVQGVKVFGAGIDTEHNAVAVSLGTAGPQQVAVLRSRYGDAPLRISGGGGPGIAG
jgi:hypothetical protein